VTEEAVTGGGGRGGACVLGLSLGRFRDGGSLAPFQGRIDRETHRKDTKFTKKSRKNQCMTDDFDLDLRGLSGMIPEGGWAE
jgi:hypothetical protein